MKCLSYLWNYHTIRLTKFIITCRLKIKIGTFQIVVLFCLCSVRTPTTAGCPGWCPYHPATISKALIYFIEELSVKFNSQFISTSSMNAPILLKKPMTFLFQPETRRRSFLHCSLLAKSNHRIK